VGVGAAGVLLRREIIGEHGCVDERRMGTVATRQMQANAAFSHMGRTRWVSVSFTESSLRLVTAMAAITTEVPRTP
jgi:hypothetical protein